MSEIKLTQTALLNVLVSEVESLRNTKGRYDKILAQTNEHLNRLEQFYQTPIPVDIALMQAEHSRIRDTLRSGFYMPKWLSITLVCFMLSFGISLFVNYKQYHTNKHNREHIAYAQDYIEKLEKKLPNHKT